MSLSNNNLAKRILIVAIVLVLSSCSQSENKKSTSASSPAVEKIVLPVSYAAPDTKTAPAKPAPTKQELMGEITNREGIRDDILQYIVKAIPPENEKAVQAAVKVAKYDQDMYYQVTSKEEAIEAAKKYSVALDCLGHAYPDEGLKISKEISRLLGDTPERNKYQWDIAHKYYAWQVLGNGGLTDDQVKEKCEKGDF